MNNLNGIRHIDGAISVMDYSNKDYMSSDDFETGNKTLTVSDYGYRDVYDKRTQKMIEKEVLAFEEEKKMLVLNATNRRRLKLYCGSFLLEKIIGKKLVIGVESGNWFGKENNTGVRIIGLAAEKKQNEKLATAKQVEKLTEMAENGLFNKNAMLNYYSCKSFSELTYKQAKEVIEKKGGKDAEIDSGD